MNSIIEKRYSPRAFAEKKVDESRLNQLFDAARWAPSSRNEQPWRFFYATKEDKEPYEKMFEILNEWNQNWAQSAPVLIAAVAKTNYDYKNVPNEHAIYDLGQAVSYLTFQATELGLYLHQMGGFSADTARKNLNLPDNFKPVAMIALGYKGELDRIPKEYQEIENGERTRNSIKSFAFKGGWK